MWEYKNKDYEPPTVTAVLFDGETPHETYTNVFSMVAVTFSEAVNVPELIENELIEKAARIDLLNAANAVTGSAVVASTMMWDGESNTLSWQIDPLSVPAGRTRLMIDAGLIADPESVAVSVSEYAVPSVPEARESFVIVRVYVGRAADTVMVYVFESVFTVSATMNAVTVNV